MSAGILVIGATGKTGKELVKLLAKNGHKTRATVRETSDKNELQALGLELVQADLNDVGSLVKAMAGIQKIYFATPLVPNIELSSSIKAFDDFSRHACTLHGSASGFNWHVYVLDEFPGCRRKNIRDVSTRKCLWPGQVIPLVPMTFFG